MLRQTLLLLLCLPLPYGLGCRAQSSGGDLGLSPDGQWFAYVWRDYIDPPEMLLGMSIETHCLRWGRTDRPDKVRTARLGGRWRPLTCGGDSAIHVMGFKFSPDSRHVAALVHDQEGGGTIRVVELASGRCRTLFHVPIRIMDLRSGSLWDCPGTIGQFGWLGNEVIGFTDGNEGSLRIQRITDPPTKGKRLADEIPVPKWPASHPRVGFSQAGFILLSKGYYPDQTLCLYRPAGRQPTSMQIHGGGHEGLATSWKADGSAVLSLQESLDGPWKCLLIHLPSGRVTDLSCAFSAIFSPAELGIHLDHRWSAGDRYVIVWRRDRKLVVIQPSPWKAIRPLEEGPSASPHKDWELSHVRWLDVPGWLCVWPKENPPFLLSVRGQIRPLDCRGKQGLAVACDGRWLATLDDDGVVQVQRITPPLAAESLDAAGRYRRP